MDRTWYLLKFKQIQPLHIGTGPYGVLSPTNIFIPGRTIWGALTRVLGEALGYTKEDIDKKKETVDKRLEKVFQEISNFYPEINGDLLLPNYKNGEFHLGKYSEKEFRYYFTDTLVSTAISPGYKSAKDESLHEIEYLLPSSKDDMNKEIVWVGIMRYDPNEKLGDELMLQDFFNNPDNKNLDNENLNNKYLNNIFVGGEQKYGYGLAKKQGEVTPLDNPNDWDIVNGNIKLKNNKAVHYLEKNANIKIIMGETELWYEIDNSKKELSLNTIRTIYRPGWKADNGKSSFNGNFNLSKGVIVQE